MPERERQPRPLAGRRGLPNGAGHRDAAGDRNLDGQCRRNVHGQHADDGRGAVHAGALLPRHLVDARHLQRGGRHHQEPWLRLTHLHLGGRRRVLLLGDRPPDRRPRSALRRADDDRKLCGLGQPGHDHRRCGRHAVRLLRLDQHAEGDPPQHQPDHHRHHRAPEERRREPAVRRAPAARPAPAVRPVARRERAVQRERAVRREPAARPAAAAAVARGVRRAWQVMPAAPAGRRPPAVPRAPAALPAPAQRGRATSTPRRATPASPRTARCERCSELQREAVSGSQRGRDDQGHPHPGRQAVSPTGRRRTRSVRERPASSPWSTTNRARGTTSGIRGRPGARLDVQHPGQGDQRVADPERSQGLLALHQPEQQLLGRRLEVRHRRSPLSPKACTW